VISGAITGLSTWLFTYPLDVVKTRMMVDYSLTYRKAVAKGALWNGLGIVLLRALLVNGSSFWLY